MWPQSHLDIVQEKCLPSVCSEHMDWMGAVQDLISFVLPLRGFFISPTNSVFVGAEVLLLKKKKKNGKYVLCFNKNIPP